MPRITKQPPIDNRYVAPGCEPFWHKPLTEEQAVRVAIGCALSSVRVMFTDTARMPLASDMVLRQRKPRRKHAAVLVIPLG